MEGGLLQGGELGEAFLAVDVEEGVVFEIFEVVKFGEGSVLETVVVGALMGFQEGGLDDWFGVRGLFWDDAFTSKDVIPGSGLVVGGWDGDGKGYHSVSALGLSIGTLTGMSGMSILNVILGREPCLEILSGCTRSDRRNWRVPVLAEAMVRKLVKYGRASCALPRAFRASASGSNYAFSGIYFLREDWHQDIDCDNQVI